MIKLGLIINPIAGMGGAVGLKGTDGQNILDQANKLGAIAKAPQRAKEFLYELRGLKTKIEIFTIPGIMGGDLAVEEGFTVNLIQDGEIPDKTELFKTNSSHTILAARKMVELNVALIVFVGGDGTARDIFTAVGTKIACLGIPGGVKIHSSVFTTTPKAAGLLTLQYLWGESPLRESEVMDIDEDAFRDNRVISKLYGYLKTPYSPTFSQPSKMASPTTDEEIGNQARIAQWLVEEMDKDEKDNEEIYYLLGPGTTPRAIATLLEQKKTLLGVDLCYQKKNIAFDLNEQQILENIQNRKVKLIVTPIGAQGFVFGRGNLQLSPQVLKAVGIENIIIIATKYKISTLPDQKLRIDSRDSEFDDQFKGLFRVLVDYGEFRIIDVIN
jgi:predicted polyphosphate/ATP-dependent NAD kinase